MRLNHLVLALTLVLFASTAQAADQWSDPSPGVRQLFRTAPGPLRIHASVIDISRPDLYLRVTRPEERGRTTTQQARAVGSVVSINGDWFESGYRPVGLAVGAGTYWEGSDDVGWSFMGCTVEKECFFDNHPDDRQHDWRWHDVVGGNGWRLLVDGQIPTYPGDSFYTDRHPRSAVGMSADGKTLILMVIEGRRNDSIGAGFRTIAQQIQSLGAHQAMMLDGGGSSALVVNGTRASGLPSGASERVVANHLSVVRGTRDGRCDATPNGRYCDGNVIHTCQGNQHMGQGDCAAFGASCALAAGNVGVCVHPFCANGPDSHYCEDATKITQCEFGRPMGTGDCAAYGATCETEANASNCVSVFCPQGADATWCEGNSIHTCVEGVPEGEPVDCEDLGLVCDPDSVSCVAPADPTEQNDPDLINPKQPDDQTPTNNDDVAPSGPSADDTVNVNASGCSTVPGPEPFTPPIAVIFAALIGLNLRRRPN